MRNVEIIKQYVNQEKLPEQCFEKYVGCFPVYCVWCAKKGIKTISYYSTIENSKGGICESCGKEAMEETVRVLKEKLRNKRSPFGDRSYS